MRLPLTWLFPVIKQILDIFSSYLGKYPQKICKLFIYTFSMATRRRPPRGPKSAATRAVPAPATIATAIAATPPTIPAKFPRTKIIPRIAIAKTPPLEIPFGLHLPHLVGQSLLLANNRTATQTDASLIVDADTLHRHRIANATHIINPVDPAIIELRNVN
jgi:hypothetical protein